MNLLNCQLIHYIIDQYLTNIIKDYLSPSLLSDHKKTIVRPTYKERVDNEFKGNCCPLSILHGFLKGFSRHCTDNSFGFCLSIQKTI